jgi:hypothetical protein
MRPDYCPVGNEPCQSLCDEPCTRTPQRKPLTDDEIGDISKNYALSNPTTPLYFARPIEAAHGIKE